LKDADGDKRQIIKTLQDQVEYLLEKCKIYEEIAVEKNEGKQITLSEDQKKRLAVKGKALNEFLLGEIEKSFAPGTILGWYTTLVGKKYNSVGPGQKQRGRPSISQEIVDKVLELARKNPDWGYDRIAAVMQYLNFQISSSTVRKILDDYGITPDPEKRARGDWNQFWDTQEAVTAAVDYAQTEVFYPFGIVRFSSFFCMDCGTREVRLGGIVHNPNSRWATQVARNLCDMWDGFLLEKKYLLRDNDVTFSRPFDNVFKSWKYFDREADFRHRTGENESAENMKDKYNFQEIILKQQ